MLTTTIAPGVKNFFSTHKKYFLYSSFLLPVIAFTVITFAPLVHASWGAWGDSSMISACLSPRGIPTILTTGECLSGETELAWVKDVDAGNGLSATRSSSGVSLALNDSILEGWYPADETWTYASAQTFTVSGDKTAKYKKGTRLKFNQSGAKYGFVIGSSYSSPNTTVTIATNNDFSIANAAISDNFYSYQDNPQGYPYTFNFTPTLNNASLGDGTIYGYISSSGNRATVDIEWNWGSTTSISGNINFATMPTPATSHEIGHTFYYDNSATDTVVGSATLAGSELYPKINSALGSSYGTVYNAKPFTWANGDKMWLHIEYQY